MKAYNNHLNSLIEQHEKDSKAIACFSNFSRDKFSISSYVRSELGLEGSNLNNEAVRSESETIKGLSGVNPNGAWVSLQSLAQRDLNLSTASALVASKCDGGLIELLRPYSAVIGAGANIISGIKQGNLILPKFKTGATVNWVTDGGNASLGEPSFEQVVIVPRTISVTLNITRRLLANSSVEGGIEDAIRRDILLAILQEVDRVALSGTGLSGEPLGIINNSNVYLVEGGPNGGEPNRVILSEMELGVFRESPSENISIITSPYVRQRMRFIQKADGLDFIWDDDDSVLGKKAFVSNSVPINLTKGTSSALSAIAMGDFSDCIIGMWGAAAVDIIVDRYSFAKEQKVRITALADIGIGIRNPRSFAVAKDMKINTSITA